MSMITKAYIRCGVCGHRALYTVTTGFYTRGSTDMDGRRPKNNRRYELHTMQKCKKCGFAFENISRGRPEELKLVKSAGYRFNEGRPIVNPYSARYYKCGLVYLGRDEPANAYFSFLNAAWSCDDIKDFIGAAVCRRRAAEVYKSIDEDEKRHFVLIHADVLRRIGRFGEAEEIVLHAVIPEKYKKAAQFQLELIRAKDRKAHSMREVKDN